MYIGSSGIWVRCIQQIKLTVYMHMGAGFVGLYGGTYALCICLGKKHKDLAAYYVGHVQSI